MQILIAELESEKFIHSCGRKLKYCSGASPSTRLVLISNILTRLPPDLQAMFPRFVKGMVKIHGNAEIKPLCATIIYHNWMNVADALLFG